MSEEYEEPPENKWTNALGLVYDTLCTLERFQMERDIREGRDVDEVSSDDIHEARLMSRAIEGCKFWKQPEFDIKFAEGSSYPEEGWRCLKCDWTNALSLTACRNCQEKRP